MLSDGTAKRALLRAFSLLIAGGLFVSIFSLHTGLVDRSSVPPVLLTLGCAVALRYAAVYHRFSKPTYRRLAVAPLALAFVASGAVSLSSLSAAVSPAELRSVFRDGAIDLGTAGFLPEWWFAVLLSLAGALILVGTVSPIELSPYPKPAEMREIAASPPYFGVVCAIFGLWSVLFVGIAIQRVLVFAPIFEELLKFGVALLVGSTLFDRSLAARVGVAVVVGSLFGIVEHATTYPTEADTVYLFRTLFHAATTVLSVGTYTLFESLEANRLQWIAPAYSILLHFFYNTFVVLSAVIGVLVFGAQDEIVSLIYGSVTILLATGLFVLVVVRERTIVAIHEPLEHVLSDLV